MPHHLPRAAGRQGRDRRLPWCRRSHRRTVWWWYPAPRSTGHRPGTAGHILATRWWQLLPATRNYDIVLSLYILIIIIIKGQMKIKSHYIPTYIEGSKLYIPDIICLFFWPGLRESRGKGYPYTMHLSKQHLAPFYNVFDPVPDRTQDLWLTGLNNLPLGHSCVHYIKTMYFRLYFCPCFAKDSPIPSISHSHCPCINYAQQKQLLYIKIYR